MSRKVGRENNKPSFSPASHRKYKPQHVCVTVYQRPIYLSNAESSIFGEKILNFACNEFLGNILYFPVLKLKHFLKMSISN